ncbi:hypothetical protein OAI07_00740 [Akkermansiaceae bacterium]|nr:hypothetical protein [Akkermansiaceae bacterium]
MNQEYEFRVGARDIGKQNLFSVGAFLFLFIVLEAAFVSIWLERHPVSFWLVNGSLAVLIVFFTVVWIRHLRIKGSYTFRITDTFVQADSPHKIMGDSFSVPLGNITKLQHLFSVHYNDGGRVRDHTNNLFAIHHTGGVSYFPEFPGHTGMKVFSEIQRMRPELPLEERAFKVAESIAFAKRAFGSLRI